MGFVPFYNMLAPVVGKDLAELLADGCGYSLPVCARRAGRLFDALFLYKPGDEPGTRPLGWVMMDSTTGKLAVLSDCEVMDFAAPNLLPPAESGKPKEELTPKKAAQMRARLNEYYESLREFVFEDEITPAQAVVVDGYKDLFMRLSLSGHYPYYYALSPAFFHWLRLPLPVGRASIEPEEAGLTDDTKQTVIMERLQRLSEKLEQKTQADNQRQEVFDGMHAELQEYKNDLLDRLTLAIELDIIKIIDDVERSVATFAGKDATTENFSRMYAMFAGVATDLEDLLYRHGVEPYRADGDEIDVMKQKVLSTTPTADKSQDKKIARRLARGWEKQGKTIRPERISAYLYQEEDNK